MRQVTRISLVVTLLVACVGCDQVSKQIARDHLVSGSVASFLGDTLRLTYAENIGAFLGLGTSLPEQARVLLFQGVVGLLVLGLIWAAVFARGLGRWQIVAVALLAASGLGNLIDRLVQDGRVTDFLNVGVGGLRTGIFNVADVVGVIGAALLLFVKSGGSPSNNQLERQCHE